MGADIASVLTKMIAYEQGCPHRVNHFLKVHSFARIIGEVETLNSAEQYILEVAAAMHDCGIRASLSKYGYYNGKMQEEEGPAVADKMMRELGIDEATRERVRFLIAHHHTYTNIVGIDYRILVEADFLVNIYEDELSADAISSIKEKYFITKKGREILTDLYQTPNEARK
ncbi:MAG: HD domain-containing protein [Acidaminococcaceae bacterium]